MGKNILRIVLCFFFFLFVITSVGLAEEIRIAQQFGLGYSPLILIEKLDLMEEYAPGSNVKWTKLGSGAAINEGLIAGKIDVGCMGVGPFLIGWDKGAPWKMASALVCQPLGLQVNDPEIRSLKDFRKEHKIALPSPGSIQHILLAMAAEKELGNPKALDNNLVAMAHPDAAKALISGTGGISAHFTSPPYIFEEIKTESIRQIVDASQAFGGDFTFLVAVATNKFHESNPSLYAAFINALNKAIEIINFEPERAAKVLALEFKLDEKTTLEYLTWPGTNFTSAPYGIIGFAEFMNKTGYIKQSPISYQEIAWENVSSIVGLKRGENPSEIERLQLK